MVGAIDWEFSYSAPLEFTYCPPVWLLLERPEDWATGLDAREAEYERRLGVFLSAMKARESELIQKGVPLPSGVKQSESGELDIERRCAGGYTPERMRPTGPLAKTPQKEASFHDLNSPTPPLTLPTPQPHAAVSSVSPNP